MFTYSLFRLIALALPLVVATVLINALAALTLRNSHSLGPDCAMHCWKGRRLLVIHFERLLHAVIVERCIQTVCTHIKIRLVHYKLRITLFARHSYHSRSFACSRLLFTFHRFSHAHTTIDVCNRCNLYLICSQFLQSSESHTATLLNK